MKRTGLPCSFVIVWNTCNPPSSPFLYISKSTGLKPYESESLFKRNNRTFILSTFVLGSWMAQILTTRAKSLWARNDRIRSLGMLSIIGMEGYEGITEPLPESFP